MAEAPSLCQWACDPWCLTGESGSSSGGTELLQWSLTLLLLLTSAQRRGEMRALSSCGTDEV